MKKTISGTIYNIKFRNSEGWAVFSLKDDNSIMINGGIPCVGILAEMCEVGTVVTCTGEECAGRYGQQFKCSSIVPEAPDVNTNAGVIKLLQRLPGIGPAKATEAVAKFGAAKAWEHALNCPDMLGVKLDQEQKAREIAASLVGSYSATVYLLGIGLTSHQAAKIYNRYGAGTIEQVSQQPYDLTNDIEGFGFLTVDKIALKAGISIGNPARVNACIKYVLDDSQTNNGNIWHRGWELVDIVLATLTDSAKRAEVSMVGSPEKDDVRKAVHFLAAEGEVVIESGRVFSARLMGAEKKIMEFANGMATTD